MSGRGGRGGGEEGRWGGREGREEVDEGGEGREEGKEGEKVLRAMMVASTQPYTYPVLLMSLEMTRAPLLSAGDENCPAHTHTSLPPSTLSTKVCEE